MRLRKSIAARWLQFRYEIVSLIRGSQLLIVNLTFIGKIRENASSPITLIVDGGREEMILRLLWIMQLLPSYHVLIVHCTQDLHSSMQLKLGGDALLIVSSTAYTKYYQFLADLRHQRRLVVL